MRYKGFRIVRHGDGFATVTAPTHAWLKAGYFVDAADRSGAADRASTPQGRRARNVLMHHSELHRIRPVLRACPPDRRIRPRPRDAR